MTQWTETSPILLSATGLSCGVLTLLWTRCVLARLPEPGDDLYLDLAWTRAPLALLAQASIGGALAVLTTARIGLHPVLACYLYLAIAAVPLAAVDLTVRRLPRHIIWPGLLILVASEAAQSLTDHHVTSMWRAFCAGALVAGLFAVLATTIGGLGLGDVRLAGWLAAALGSLGWRQTATGILAGFILAILTVITRRILRRTPDRYLAFGPHLLAGAFLVLLS